MLKSWNSTALPSRDFLLFILSLIAIGCSLLRMEIADYYPILVQISLAAGIGAVILIASHVFGQRAQTSTIKDSPYECGMLAEGSGHARFAVKFYVTAMLFILFDIEVVFLIPWVLVFREFLAASLPILLPVFFFLAVLVLGLIYELKKGAIEWES